jgi:hypothetical protein
MGRILIQQSANHLFKKLHAGFDESNSDLYDSSFRTSSSGEGRKSEITFTFPTGSSVYFLFDSIEQKYKNAVRKLLEQGFFE